MKELLGRIMEAEDIFKPRDPAEIEKAEAEKKAKEDTRKDRIRAQKELCPKCGEDLKSPDGNGVVAYETTWGRVYMSFNPQTAEWDYGYMRTDDSETTEYHCGSCDEELSMGEDFNKDPDETPAQ